MRSGGKQVLVTLVVSEMVMAVSGLSCFTCALDREGAVCEDGFVNGTFVGNHTTRQALIKTCPQRHAVCQVWKLSRLERKVEKGGAPEATITILERTCAPVCSPGCTLMEHQIIRRCAVGKTSNFNTTIDLVTLHPLVFY